MIINSVKNAISDQSDDGRSLNEIVDEFREGRNSVELLQLLDSNESELIAIGVWIFSELPFSAYNSDIFIEKLNSLTTHDDPLVRFNSINALYPALMQGHESVRISFTRLCEDINNGVSDLARAAQNSLPRKL